MRINYARFRSNWMKRSYLKSTGKVTEVCRFSLLEDQITIEVEIPSSQGEKSTKTRCVDWAVPAGTLKVGMRVKLAFVE